MKRIIVFICAICYLHMIVAQCTIQYKKHNWGLGIASVLSSSTNQHLKYIGYGIAEHFGKLDNNFDIILSARYEYSLNNNIALGSGVSCRFNRMELALQINMPNEWIFIEKTKSSYCMFDTEIPLYMDCKTTIMSNTNIFGGIGVSGQIKLFSDSDYLKKKTLTPYLLLRTGFEFMSKHNVQFLLQYRINLTKSEQYILEKTAYLSEDLDFRVHTFDIGINFLF